MLFKKFFDPPRLTAAHTLSCSERYSNVVDIFCYVQTRSRPLFEESMPVAVNHVKLRNTLAVSELYIGRNTIIIFTVVIVFMNQSSNTNAMTIDLSNIFSGESYKLHRFLSPAVGGYLADFGRTTGLRYERRNPQSPYAVWRVIKPENSRDLFYIQNHQTKRYVCFSRRGKPRLKNSRDNRCGMTLYERKLREPLSSWKKFIMRFQLKHNYIVTSLSSRKRFMRFELKHNYTDGEKSYWNYTCPNDSSNTTQLKDHKVWEVGFCANGRPFMNCKASTRRRCKLEPEWNLFVKCTARLPPPCRGCLINGVDTAYCGRECRMAYYCNPGQKRINLGSIFNQRRRGSASPRT